jgi:hypothetical protein
MQNEVYRDPNPAIGASRPILSNCRAWEDPVIEILTFEICYIQRSPGKMTAQRPFGPMRYSSAFAIQSGSHF